MLAIKISFDKSSHCATIGIYQSQFGITSSVHPQHKMKNCLNLVSY